MKDNLDLWAVIVGILASLLKGIKNKLASRELVIAGIIGGLLAWGTLGIIDFVFGNKDPRIIMLVSFSVGWVANELTDVLDQVVKDAYSLFHTWAKQRFNKKK